MALGEQKTVWVDTTGPEWGTPRAELHDFGHGDTWVPKSVIGARGNGRIELALWWAEKHGLVDQKDER